MKKINLPHLEDTEQLAKNMAQKLKGGEVIGLVGPLGAGKTTFVQYLAKHLGVKEQVKSPSFALLQTYKTRLTPKILTLCHVDLYRLKDDADLSSFGLEDYLGQKNVVTVIEWADKIKNISPTQTMRFSFDLKKNKRTVAMIQPK